MARRFVIVGAGPAGTHLAYKLQQQGHTVTLLEKAPEVGGMCRTYHDGAGHITEEGAVVMSPNYLEILGVMRELGLSTEETFPSLKTPMQERFASMGVIEKLKSAAKFIRECARFAYDVYRYNRACKNAEPLPDDLTIPFSEYIARHNIEISEDIYRGLLPGCGYGAFEDIPTWYVLDFLGYTTAPMAALPNGLKSVKGGYQSYVKAMADKLETVVTNANITSIIRDSEKAEDGITVTYQHPEQGECTVVADELILAIPPKNYTDLGMELTELEDKCAKQMESLNYPTVICKIEGMPPRFQFYWNALKKEGFNQGPSLITTRDTSDDRLCTAYFNVNKECDITFDDSLDTKALLAERIKQAVFDGLTDEEKAALPDGEVEVEILKVNSWAYFKRVNHDLRCQVKAAEGENHTHHVGAAYTFEDVGCAVKSTEGVSAKFCAKTPSFFKQLTESGKSFFSYWYPPQVAEEQELQSQQEVAVLAQM